MVRVALVVLALAIGLVVLLLLGPLLAVILALVLWRDWLGLRSWLARVAPAIGNLRPGLLAVGGFLVIALAWSGLATAAGMRMTPATPTPAEAKVERAPVAEVPSATATPAPTATAVPTATPIPSPTRAAGLGLSRQHVQSTYAKVGFTFQDQPLADGTPRLIGDSPDHLAILEISGPPENIQSVTLLVFYPKDGGAAVVNTVYLLGLVGVVAPDWTEGTRWVADHLGEAIEKGSVTTVVGRRTVQLRVLKELGAVGLTIDGRPA